MESPDSPASTPATVVVSVVRKDLRTLIQLLATRIAAVWRQSSEGQESAPQD